MPEQPQRLPAVVGAGAGILAAVLGLLPWLVTGGTAPLQNLWATSTPPDDMPFVLLPFSQYHVTTIIGLVVVGSGVAGLAGRVLRPRLGRGGVAALVGGLLLVQVPALGQTALEINAGLEAGTSAALYLGTLVAVTALAVVTGLVSLLLVALAPRAGAVVGLSVAALALAPWLTAPWVAIGEPLFAIGGALGLLARWLPPVLVGAAIAWGGLRTVARVLAAVAGLVLVWIVPALSTAIQASLGSRVLLHDLSGAVDHFLRVLVSAATIPVVALPPVAVCVVAAGLGLVVYRAEATWASSGS